jgi:hypothetical protein
LPRHRRHPGRCSRGAARRAGVKLRAEAARLSEHGREGKVEADRRRDVRKSLDLVPLARGAGSKAPVPSIVSGLMARTWRRNRSSPSQVRECRVTCGRLARWCTACPRQRRSKSPRAPRGLRPSIGTACRVNSMRRPQARGWFVQLLAPGASACGKPGGRHVPRVGREASSNFEKLPAKSHLTDSGGAARRSTGAAGLRRPRAGFPVPRR